jgi:hypothetical protein
VIWFPSIVQEEEGLSSTPISNVLSLFLQVKYSNIRYYGYWKCMFVDSLTEYIGPPLCSLLSVEYTTYMHFICTN